MFTGIIEEVARLEALEPLETGFRFTVRCSIPSETLRLGESIALDGACMTVVAARDGMFDVEVSQESLRRTTLGERKVGDGLNLERSVRAGDRLGGHVVSGHVDGTGRIAAIEPKGDSWIYRFEVDPAVAALTVEKGSVAVDGISLTCFHCGPNSFDVAVIRHTAESTTLGSKKKGARVNVENDMLGKYVAKLVEGGSKP